MSEAEKKYFVVRLERGGPWDWSRDMRQQQGWDAHASFMDSLVAQGLILLGGPLDGHSGRYTLHIFTAPSAAAIRHKLADDPWSQNGMLTVKSIEQWTVLLDARKQS